MNLEEYDFRLGALENNEQALLEKIRLDFDKARSDLRAEFAKEIEEAEKNEWRDFLISGLATFKKQLPAVMEREFRSHGVGGRIGPAHHEGDSYGDVVYPTVDRTGYEAPSYKLLKHLPNFGPAHAKLSCSFAYYPDGSSYRSNGKQFEVRYILELFKAEEGDEGEMEDPFGLGFGFHGRPRVYLHSLRPRTVSAVDTTGVSMATEKQIVERILAEFDIFEAELVGGKIPDVQNEDPQFRVKTGWHEQMRGDNRPTNTVMER